MPRDQSVDSLIPTDTRVDSAVRDSSAPDMGAADSEVDEGVVDAGMDSFVRTGPVYAWNGATDDDWYNPGNWTVSGSAYTHPNEQHGHYFVNNDANYIDIIDGGSVQTYRNQYLSIGSPDTFVYLTVDNSTLRVEGLYVADKTNWRDCRVTLRNNAHLESVGLLKLDDGYSEMHVTNSTVSVVVDTLDPIEADKSGYLSIGDSAAGLDGTEGHFFSDNSTLTTAGDLRIAPFRSSSVGELNMRHGSVATVGANVDIGGSGQGRLIMRDSSFGAGGRVIIGRYPASGGSIQMLRSSSLSVPTSLYVGLRGNGQFSTTNSMVDIDESLYIRTYDSSGHSGMQVRDSFITVGRYLILNSIEDPDADAVSGDAELTVHSGMLSVASGCYFNSNIGPLATARVQIHGGTLRCEGSAYLNYNTDGVAHVTVNVGGTLVTGSSLRFGKASSGDDHGSARLYLYGGVVQAEDLLFEMTDAKIVFRQGEFRVLSSAVSEVQMQAFLDAGRIDTAEAAGHEISTVDGYTVLSVPAG